MESKLATLLSNETSLLGLKAPILIWYAALGLFFFTICATAWLITKCLVVGSRLRNLRRKITALLGDHPEVRREGWSLALLDEVRKLFESENSFKSPWEVFETSLVKIERGSEAKYFSGVETGAFFSFDELIGKYINVNFWSAVPTLVTGIGLMFTFLAILIALMGVHVGLDKQVAGVEGLINGLSGKFISSIVALSCAVVFSVFEKVIMHRLEVEYLKLVQVMTVAFPRESTEKLLARVEKDLSEQSIAFRLFNTDLSGLLKDSFRESMGPTLNNMVETLNKLRESQEVLNKSIAGITQGNQEIIASRIETLVQKLESTLLESFRAVTNELRNLFTQSTRGQFDALSQEIAKTANIMERLNERSESSQHLMDKMMEEFQSSTGTALQKLAETMEASLHGFKESALGLTQQMSQNLQGMVEQSVGHSEKAISRANDTIEQASKATSGMTDAWTALEGASEKLKTTIDSFSELMGSVKGTTDSWLKMESQLNALATSTKRAQEEQERTASHVAKQTESLLAGISRSDTITQRYEDIFQKYETTVHQFSQVFVGLEERLGKVLKTISNDMRTYQEALHEGLEKITSVGDKYFTSVSQKLKETVESVEETLGEFTEILEKTRDGSTREVRK